MFQGDETRARVPNAVDTGELDLPNVVDQAEVRFAIVSSNLRDRKKGVYDFVDLARRCESMVPRARFLIIGPDTPDTTALEKDQREGRMAQKCEIFGLSKDASRGDGGSQCRS